MYFGLHALREQYKPNSIIYKEFNKKNIEISLSNDIDQAPNYLLDKLNEIINYLASTKPYTKAYSEYKKNINNLIKHSQGRYTENDIVDKDIFIDSFDKYLKIDWTRENDIIVSISNNILKKRIKFIFPNGKVKDVYIKY